MKYYAHGDVILGVLTELPEGLTPVQTDVLALGESTGHAHMLVGGKIETFVAERDREDLMVTGGDVFIRVIEAATIQHLKHGVDQADHAPIILEPGIYRAHQQREHDWFEGDRAIHD